MRTTAGDAHSNVGWSAFEALCTYAACPPASLPKPRALQSLLACSRLSLRKVARRLSASQTANLVWSMTSTATAQWRRRSWRAFVHACKELEAYRCKRARLMSAHVLLSPLCTVEHSTYTVQQSYIRRHPRFELDKAAIRESGLRMTNLPPPAVRGAPSLAGVPAPSAGLHGSGAAPPPPFAFQPRVRMKAAVPGQPQASRAKPVYNTSELRRELLKRPKSAERSAQIFELIPHWSKPTGASATKTIAFRQLEDKPPSLRSNTGATQARWRAPPAIIGQSKGRQVARSRSASALTPAPSLKPSEPLREPRKADRRTATKVVTVTSGSSSFTSDHPISGAPMSTEHSSQPPNQSQITSTTTWIQREERHEARPSDGRGGLTPSGTFLA